MKSNFVTLTTLEVLFFSLGILNLSGTGIQLLNTFFESAVCLLDNLAHTKKYFPQKYAELWDLGICFSVRTLDADKGLALFSNFVQSWFLFDHRVARSLFLGSKFFFIEFHTAVNFPQSVLLGVYFVLEFFAAKQKLNRLQILIDKIWGLD
jgi:hypothetical protein